MLTLSDYVKNLEKECESIQNVKQAYVLEKYTEDNLLFLETGNRMNDTNLFLFKKDDQIELCIIEDLDIKIYNAFPIVFDIESLYNRSSKEYKFYETGFGGLLCVKNSCYEKFNNELIKLAKENEVEFYDNYPNDNFIHGYWISVAKKII